MALDGKHYLQGRKKLGAGKNGRTGLWGFDSPLTVTPLPTTLRVDGLSFELGVRVGIVIATLVWYLVMVA